MGDSCTTQRCFALQFLCIVDAFRGSWLQLYHHVHVCVRLLNFFQSWIIFVGAGDSCTTMHTRLFGVFDSDSFAVAALSHLLQHCPGWQLRTTITERSGGSN